VGIRNITKLVVGGVSPFNIADQVNLPMFSFTNVKNLYEQYTQETNQPFSDEAVQQIYEETCGQPWLVNRLGTILTGAYVQFRGSGYHTRNARFRQPQEQRRAKAQR